LVFNPATPLNVLENVMDKLDMILLMSVNPGFGGQSFIENTYDKVKALKELIQRKGANTLIEIDGGVTDGNAKKLVDAGADILVAGSFVFKSQNPTTTIAHISQIANG
jgi:ribulose-phosphate 3-epimerase